MGPVDGALLVVIPRPLQQANGNAFRPGLLECPQDAWVPKGFGQPAHLEIEFFMVNAGRAVDGQHQFQKHNGSGAKGPRQKAGEQCCEDRKLRKAAKKAGNMTSLTD